MSTVFLDESTYIEQELNRLLRPGAKPELPYTTSPRHAAVFIAEYEIGISWYDNSVHASMKLGGTSLLSTASFYVAIDRKAAMCKAVAKVMMSALHIIEREQRHDARSVTGS